MVENSLRDRLKDIGILSRFDDEDLEVLKGHEPLAFPRHLEENPCIPN